MIRISARVENREGEHHVQLQTGDNAHDITIPPQGSGFGSSANGGELLFLALATCYCNDIYREAAARNIKVTRVQVNVEGEFDGVPGHPLENVVYHATVAAEADEDTILNLMLHTDTVAEVQNTLRGGCEVTLGSIKAVSVD